MHTGLIAHFDDTVQTSECGVASCDCVVFRLVRGIGIEIEDVVILDPVIGRAVGEAIPGGLEQRAGNEPGVQKPDPG